MVARRELLGVAVILAIIISLTIYSFPPTTTCNNPRTIIQCGIQTVSIAAGATSGTVTVTFPAAFPAVPASILLTMSTTPSTANILPFQTLTFVSLTTTGQTWAAFPVVSTEIFGDTNGEHRVASHSTTPGPYAASDTVGFSVACGNPATFPFTGTETLRPQFSYDGGVTWASVSNTVTGLDAPLGTLCLSSQNPVYIQSGINATLAGTVSAPIFRLVGFGGDGAISQVNFTEIQLLFYGSLSPFAVPQWGSRTTTSFILTVKVPLALSQGVNLTVDWEAKL